jgi:hypothetical protein
MRITLSIWIALMALNGQAQRIVYAEPEVDYDGLATYNIIGKVGPHYLIHIKGMAGSEIAAYDDSMHKVSRDPLTQLPPNRNKTEFLNYPDKFYLVSQYQQGNFAHLNFHLGDADGKVAAEPIFRDSLPLPFRSVADTKPLLQDDWDRPSYLVIRSEDRQWIMALHVNILPDKGHILYTTLLDKNLQIVERNELFFRPLDDGGNFTEFILDNDGDLVFAQQGLMDDDGSVHKLLMVRKVRGIDSLYAKIISTGPNGLDDPRLRADNFNRKYFINAFYRKPGDRNITGICSMIWNKDKDELSSASFNIIPLQTRLEARNDLSSPDEILNHFYLRQVFPRKDGGSIVLAEMCWGQERYYPDLWKRLDFISGAPESILAPPHQFIFYRPHDKPGRWQNMTRMPTVRSPLTFNGNKYTDDIIVMFFNKDAELTGQRVIKKAEFSPFANLPLSYQYMLDNKSVHVLYNVSIRGKYLPYSTSIKGDGTVEHDPLPYGLDNKHIFLPQFAKQVGPNLAIVPAHFKNYLRFTLMEY